MNLAFYYPIIFWNTANLIVDSGAEFLLKDTEEEDAEEKEENDDQLEEEELAKTARVSNYGRLASAIGQMQNEGVSVLPPDINDSKLTFTPNVERDVILFGLRGIVSVGSGVVNQILEHRPFYSLDDFLQKVKANKTQVVSLIKSGAFDFLDSRENIMNEYLEYITDTKSTVNLRNVQMLISHDLLGKGVEFEAKVFNFNKYIRKGYDKKGFLKLDENSQPFYEKHFDLDKLDVNEEGESVLPEPYWKKIYDGHMNKVRKYIKENHDYLVEKLNERLVEENRVKYASGSLAKWSMDSVNFYQGEHELEHADLRPWGVIPFSKLPEEPVVKNRFRSKQGNWVEMYELNYIAGTVVDKSPLKSEITLLTTDGIVMVKAYGVMSVYDKQISQKVAEGKSKIVERSMFARGTKVIVHGMRTGAHSFIAKKYARDNDKHHFMRILEVQEDGTCIVQEERAEVE